MNKYIIVVLLTLLWAESLFTQSAVNPPGSANFSWWRAVDVEAGLTKEEIFDAYLQDLISVGKIGYKALPTNITQLEQQKSSDSVSSYYLKQGNIVNTDNVTDFAIRGQGFFKLSNDNGEIFYSRAGNFRRDPQGFLRNIDGFRLEPPLQLDSDQIDLFIDEQATLWQSISKIRDAKNLYQFELWLPQPNSKIERVGLHFSFSDTKAVKFDAETRILIKSLELSTSEGVKTLAQMTQILYDLRNEDDTKESLDFRLYIVDFLLKEYSKSQGNLADLEKFSLLTESISSSIIFSKNDR